MVENGFEKTKVDDRFLKGKQRLIPTFGQHRGVKLLGKLNYETGEVES